MKIFKFIFKEVILPASFFFTIFNIIAYLIEFVDSGNSTKVINFTVFLIYFIIVASVNNIFKTELSMFLKVVIHYLGLLIPLMGLVVIMGKDNTIPAIFTVLTVAYAIIATPVLIVRNLVHKKDNEESKYDSQFL